MRRVRILGYLYQEKNQPVDSPFYFANQSDDDTKCYFPLADDVSVYVLSRLTQLDSIHAFTDAMECWFPNMFYTFRSIHRVLDRVWTACPFGVPTEEQWKSLDCNECSFFVPSSARVCPHIERGPLYLFPSPVPKGDFDDTDMYWCIVHPEESERMERILNGTDNPLYDLVHELRYNPNISSKIGSERQEAQQDFEQAKKRKV
jgi:hypothetical protein